MKSFDFASIIRTYEKKRANVIYEKRQSTKDEDIIKVDIDRTFLSIPKTNNQKTIILRRILHDVLIIMPIPYVQGMNDICSIFVYYYFNEEFETLNETKEIIINADLLEQTRITITNMLIDKYEPLIANDFKLYLHYNNVFVCMMKKRGIVLDPTYCLKYMNVTLTWFTRLVSNYDGMKTLVGIILACPVSMVFVLLVKFYGKASKNIMINEIEEDLCEQVIAIEKEFLATEAVLKEKKGVIGTKMIIFGGALVVAVAAAIMFKRFGKKE